MVRLVKLMLVVQGFLLSCNGTEEAPDEVVELVYSERVVRQRIKRRFDLLSAGCR